MSFVLKQPLKQLRRIARNAAKDYGLGLRIPQAYSRAAVAPVDPRKVLFLESSLAEMPDAFKLLFERFSADSRFDARYVSLGKYRVSAREYLHNCNTFAEEAATARIIYLCDASDVVSALPLRPETRVVQLWHACGAFKRFGMSTSEHGYGLSRADIERHPFYKNLNLVTVSSPEIEWAYVQAMCLEGSEDVVRGLGVSRTDVFFDPAFHEQAFRHLYETVPEALGKRVVLYAPTYRGDLSCAREPLAPDYSALKAALGGHCVLLVKQHPMVKELSPIPDDCADFAFEVTLELPIDELLVVADALITDYSSVIFEFSLFERPMAFFTPDLEEYIEDRDFYYDFKLMTPGPIFAESEGLASWLARTFEISHSDAIKEEQIYTPVAAFREMFMSACDGRATERIFDFSISNDPTISPNALVRTARSGILMRRPHVAAARIVLNAAYRLLERENRADEVVFLSRQTNTPSYDFAELARRFEEQGWKATMHLQKVSVRNFPAYAAHVTRELKLLGRCKLVVLDRYDPVVSLLDFTCERSDEDAPCGPVNVEHPIGPCVLQLWHAFGAFKKFGFQYVNTTEGHSADFTADWRIHRNNTWVACSGVGARTGFAEALSCPEERVIALRRPEYDELVALREERERAASNTAKPAHTRPRILIAPTLRTSALSAHPIRELYAHHSEWESQVNADIVWAFHPLEENLPAPGNVSKELLECDVVVTDYSSLVYEAYLLGKPVFFYVPDIDSYRLTPGLNHDPLELSPEICAKTEQELSALLNAPLDNYPLEALERFIGDAFTGALDPIDFLLGRQ